MILLFDVVWCLIGFTVMTAAIIYLVNQKAALRMLTLAVLSGFALVLISLLAVQVLHDLGAPAAALVIFAASLIAYFIREHRRPHKAPAQRAPGGERKPLLPSSGGES